MPEANIERVSQEIPIKRIASLRKDIAKYEEHVNKCDISATNILAERIGSDMDFLNYPGLTITEEQRKEVGRLEHQFSGYMDHLKRCRCVKKIEK